MNKKFIPILIILMFFLINFNGSSHSIILSNSKKISSIQSNDIELWGDKIIFDAGDGNYIGFTGITRSINGDLLIYVYTSGVSPAGKYVFISKDNGLSWSEPIHLNTDPINSDISWAISATPDGSILAVLYGPGSPEDENGYPLLYRSFDNGQTWNFWRSVTEFGPCQFYDIFLYDQTLYACVEDPSWDDAVYIAQSFDNGVSFSKLGNDVVSSGSSEWSVMIMEKLGQQLVKIIHMVQVMMQIDGQY